MAKSQTIEMPPGVLFNDESSDIEMPPGISFDEEGERPITEPLLSSPEADKIYQHAELMLKSEKEKKKIENSLILAQVMQKDPSYIYQNHDVIIDKMKELDEQTPDIGPVEAFVKSFTQSMAGKYATVARGATAWTPLKGFGTDKLALAVSDYLEGLRNPKVKKETEQLLAGKLWPVRTGEKWYNVDAKMIPQVTTNWAAQVGDQIPIMLITLGGRLGSKLIGRLVGTAIGAATLGPDPTDTVTVPALSKATEKFIQIAGTATPLISLETANYMDAAREYGIDADLSEKYGRFYGLGAGVIEYSQNMFMLAPFNKMGAQAKKKILRRILEEAGGDVFEGVEEFTQQALQNYFTNKAIDEMRKRNPEYNAEKIPITAGGGKSFLAAAGVAAITRGGGHISGTVYNKFSAYEKKQVGVAGVKPVTKAQEEAAKSYIEKTEEFKEKPVSTVAETEEDIAEKVLETRELPEGTYIHGRDKRFKFGEMGSVLLTKDIETAESYAGDEGEIWLISPKKGTRVVDYSNRHTADMDTLIKTMKEMGDVPDIIAGDISSATGVDFNDVTWEVAEPYIREAFAPESIIDSAEAFESEWSEWAALGIGDYENISIIKTPDGAVVYDLNNINKIELRDKTQPKIEKGEEKSIKKTPEKIESKTIKEQPYFIERQELAKKIEDVKLRNEIQIGKAKIGDFIGKEKAAKVSGKKIEEAARKGVVTGKKIGTVKEKARKAELEIRAKEKKAVRTYITKLAGHISKEPGKGIDFYYRKAIETIQSGIDPLFRTEKTLQKRERIRQFLKEHPERIEDMPKKTLQTIEKKSMDEMSISELEGIAEEVEHLRKQGKLKQQIKDNQHKKRIGTDVREMTSEVLSGEEISKEAKPIVASTTKEGRLKKAPRFVRAFTLRPTRIFHKIFGGDKTTGYKRFVDEENRAVDQELRETDKRTEAVKKEMAKLDITSRDLAKTRKIDGTKYTIDEMIDIYAGFKNPLKQIAIIYGNKINEKTADKIINALSDKEKAFADFIIKEYENRYPELRNAHIEFRNEDLGHEESYTPIRRQEIEYKTLDAELADELLHKTHLRKAYAARGFTKARVEIPKQFQKPIRLGLYATWLDQAPKQEHYISHAQLVKELQAISHNSTFQEAVKQEYGNEYLERINNYVDRIADPLVYRSFHGLENVSRMLRQHTAMAYLAYNLVTMAKQLPSVMLYLPHSGPTHLIGAALKFSTNPFKTIREVNEKDPQMKHRSIERELEEFKQMNKPGYERALKKVGKTGMVGIYAMDKIATTIGWYATYSKNIQMGKSESVAVRAAQKATLETQPAAHVKDVAELYATSEYVNLFTQFSNQLNQIYNITTYDIPKYFKEHEYYKALLATTGLSITAAMIWIISHRRLPEKPKDITDMAEEQFINSIPLIGRQIAAAKSGWMSTAPPVFKPIEGIGKLMSDASKKAKVNAMLEGGAIAMGLPYTGPKRVIKAMTKGKPEELIGGKPRR